jgi:hypothetical protein
LRDWAINGERAFSVQATFQREEQRRFEILLAHWDLPIVEDPIALPAE